MTSLPVPGLGSSRGSQLLGGSYNGNHDMISTNTLQNMAGIQTGPAWLESDAAGSALELQYTFHNMLVNVCGMHISLWFELVSDDSKRLFGIKG